ncbi:lysine decarboxylase family protein [Tanticharoenia sakaeratensis NBRC 103193]|jgi:uncharacterized protein (TIGR00730 family)|uniref:Cytokinin riboside 5'-monophosphate phosphoribohydrolase n=2 Tax=Tanticharoenia TaxID=444052 RepID=A0A0D6MPY7_9PROT|nr:lysine decarboxylase family protein [Tanticharoenia sakaeratensis NBRC 103193]GBQ24824.1 lysine decarboxylase [Tanticharoenia sakaeratensis NBRC 103193]
MQAARELGMGLAQAGITLVYGGGNVGLMGSVADGAISRNGAVYGVIPTFLRDREVMHHGVMDLEVTETMHERKTRMFARADVFLILPGGLGTFDELMEIMTWRQLGLHDKPILIVDIAGWSRFVVAAVDAAIAQGFASPTARDLFEVVPDVAAALSRLSEGATPATPGEVERL